MIVPLLLGHVGHSNVPQKHKRLAAEPPSGCGSADTLGLSVPLLRESRGSARARLCAAKEDRKHAIPFGGVIETATVLRMALAI